MLGTQYVNTYLSISSGSNIQDSNSGNELIALSFQQALQVDSFTPDTTRPQVIVKGFKTFDLNAGQFTITFSEPMDISTITTPVDLFQHQANALLAADTFLVENLDCNAPECQNNETVTFTLPHEELNRLKLAKRICFSTSTCWLTIHTGNFIRDMASNPVVELPNGEPKYPRILVSVIDDTDGPILQAYTLNLTSRELILSFDEPVEANSFDSTGITLLSGIGAAGTELTYQLTNGVLMPSIDGAIITLHLSDNDVNELQSRSKLANMMSNTYLSLDSRIARDVSYWKNVAQEIPTENALLVSAFIPDLAPPQIKEFDLDLDSNSITIRFTEPVLINSLNLDRLILSSSRSGEVTYNITGGTLQITTLAASSEITFFLPNDDVAYLKVSGDIGTMAVHTFLASEDSLAEDTNKIASTALLLSQAIQVSSFSVDASPPIIIGFSLDMNTGIAIITFDDVVLGNIFDVSAITFQNARNRVPLKWHTLSPSSSSNSLETGFFITIYFGSEDLNRLKQIRNLTTSASNSFLTATATAVNDVSGLDVIAITDGNAIPVNQFKSDSIRPFLQGWTLDLNVGQVILTFSETVNIPTLQPSLITISASQSSYTLTGYAQLIPRDADSHFAIQLSQQDANNIKVRTILGTVIDNSFISFKRSTVQDMNSNDVIAISGNNALQAAAYVQDTTSPILQSFSLDVNTGLLTLKFDETVEATSVNISAFSLVNRASTITYALADGSHSATNSAIIIVELSSHDLNALKATAGLVTAASDTFISVMSSGVRDMNQNLLFPITSDSPLQVGQSAYTRDATSPNLHEFSINMSSEQLHLTFSETVSTLIVDLTQITIQSQINSANIGSESITLTGGTVTRSDGTVIILQLDKDDANEFKRVRNICTTEANTFISIMETAMQDSAGNFVHGIASMNALQAALVLADTVQPQLQSFALDLDQRQLFLFFDETVDSGTFSATSITLQDSAINPLQSIRLESFSRTDSADGTQLVVELSSGDFNAITSTFPLATMDINTFIALETGTVQDTSGVLSSAIPTNNALQITNHTADHMRPSLVNFDLDLDNGVITGFFSESVNVTSVDSTQITIQNAPNTPSSMFLLTGGMVNQRDSTTIDITLLLNDLNSIKKLTNLASIRSNTYISITAGTLTDMNANPVMPISMSSALLTRRIAADLSGPIIQGFDMDYNTGDMIIYFDETIDLDTFEVNAVSLQTAEMGLVERHTLQNINFINTGFETMANFHLSNDDLNDLKRLRICVMSESCFLSVTSNLVTDLSNNHYVSSSSAIMVGLYIPDHTRPQLVKYTDFDLDSGTFTLEFSETMDVLSCNDTEITVDSDYTNATFRFIFYQLEVVGSDSSKVTFQLDPDNLNKLKWNTNLCTHNGNCWIRLSERSIQDVSGNFIIGVLPDTINTFHQPQTFIPDVTPPILLSFSFDLDEGIMTFTFNEVVRLGTFSPLNITFQDAKIPTTRLRLRENGKFYRSTNGLVIEWNITAPDLNLLKSYEYLFSSSSNSYLIYSNFIDDNSGVHIGSETEAFQVSEYIHDTTGPILQQFRAFNFDNGTLTLQFDEPVNKTSINLFGIAITKNESFDLHIYDHISINDWYSVLYENGTIYNLTHTFKIGEYILNCPFSFTPRMSQVSVVATSASRDINGNESGSGDSSNIVTSSKLTMTDLSITKEDSSMPLRGCIIYRNLTVIEPFHFLTGGEITYIDERKQQVQVVFNKNDLRVLKLSLIIASSNNNTWIAFNDTAISDFAQNYVRPSNLFNATKLQNGNFISDITAPTFDFFVLDMDSSVLSIYFNDIMDVQSIYPLLIEISEFPGSNNSYPLQGPYLYPNLLTVDPEDNYNIDIALSHNDMNRLKNDFELATSEFNTYIAFPREIATDIYGRYPNGINSTQVQLFIPDQTGPVLLSFSLDYERKILNLTFDEVVNPNTVNHLGITIQNVKNSNNSEEIDSVEFHTFVEGGAPVDNTTGVSTIQLALDLDLNALQIASYLGHQISNTYIVLESGSVLDMNNNSNQEIRDGNAVQVMTIVDDTSPPSLEYFDLNLNDNILILKFSEAIIPETINVSAISLQDIRGTVQGIMLDQDSSIVPRGYNSLIYIHLTAKNEEEIKDPSSSIAKSDESTFISIESELAENYIEFKVVNISQFDALPVREYFEGMFMN